MHKNQEHKKRKKYTRKQLIRIDIIKHIVFCVCVLVPVLAVILIMDFIDTNRQDPLEEMPSENVVVQQVTTTTTEPEVEMLSTLPLPKQTYAYVGKPITFYFLNLTGLNSLKNVEVEVETGGKGKVYKDRWEYTPQKAETVKFQFTARNKKNVVISEGSCTIKVKEQSEQEKLTMLFIGDSTITGGYETKHILEMAKQDNYNITLLGTQIPSYLNDVNNKHEGRSGWQAHHFANTAGVGNTANLFYNPTIEEFDFRYYMESQWYADVDCVCIQLGFNDVFAAQSDSILYKSYLPQYISNIQTIVNSIHEYNPDIKIILNLILPGSTDQKKFEYGYEMSQTAERYKRNTYLSNLDIIESVNGMKNVYIAPINAALNTEKNMAASGHGAVHPNEEGYKEIAAQLYTFIRAIN